MCLVLWQAAQVWALWALNSQMIHLGNAWQKSVNHIVAFYIFFCMRLCLFWMEYKEYRLIVSMKQFDSIFQSIKLAIRVSGSPTVHSPSFPDSAPNWTSLCTCLREIGKIHHLENVIFFSLPAVHSLFCPPSPPSLLLHQNDEPLWN